MPTSPSANDLRVEVNFQLDMGLEKRRVAIADDADKEKAQKCQAQHDGPQPHAPEAALGPVAPRQPVLHDLYGSLGSGIIHIAP